jgi:pimeloyl-ACP methyl ester carboxylesterase
VSRHVEIADYGASEVEDRLGEVTHPVLVLAGRHDRTCVVEGGEAIAAGIPGAQLAVFEATGHLTFAERTRRT